MTVPLPDGCQFGYYVMHEAWHANALLDRRPEVMVGAYANEGGCAWEFCVEDRSDLGLGTVQLKVFSDAFEAITQIPEFFAALASERPRTLSDVRLILDRLGAVDKTERVRGEVPA